jgi:hypothetical protein
MPKKGELSPHRGKPRPNAWITGPDPVLHKKYLTWLQQRNQARWRGETWELTFESWCDKWKDLWENRGRERGDYCMTRHDIDGPWDDVNSVIMTRKEHNLRHVQRQYQLGKTRGYKQRRQNENL